MLWNKGLSRNVVVFKVLSRGMASGNEKNVAFLGLGNMGAHMASNLAKKGFKVTGYDVSADALKAASSLGITPQKSIAAAVKNAGFVVSILPNNQIVRDVYLGKDGVLDSVSGETMLIDSSTVDPSVPRDISKKAEDKQISFIDAPVSGGVMGAQNATLAFMVGGVEAQMERARPVLEAMGARLFHCGPTGAGQVAKLCNNLLMAITMGGTAEVLKLAIKSGMDAKLMLDIINSSSGRSWSSEVYCPVPGLVPTVPSSKNYQGGFSTDLLVKDLGLVSKLITDSNTPLAFGSLAVQMYRLSQAQGHGGKDFSYIYQLLGK